MKKTILNFIKDILEMYNDISSSNNPDVFKNHSNVIYISNIKSQSIE